MMTLAVEEVVGTNGLCDHGKVCDLIAVETRNDIAHLSCLQETILLSYRAKSAVCYSCKILTSINHLGCVLAKPSTSSQIYPTVTGKFA